MDVVIPRKDLERILACHEVADRKSAVPALANVLLTAKDGHLTAQGTDLYCSMADSAAAEITKPGAIALPAKDLFERVKAMPDGPVQLRLVESCRALLSAVGAKRQYTIHGLSADDFPPLPQPSGDAIEMPALQFKRLMDGTHFSISTDETRAHVNSALFEAGGNRLRMVSTDGHRLSKIEMPWEGHSVAWTSLIPLKAIGLLRRFADAKDAALTIRQGGASMFFTIGTATFSTNLVEAQFPPYAQVIPSSTSRSVNVDRSALIDALKAVRLSADDKTSGVKMNFGADVLRIESESVEAGSGLDEVPIEPSGAEMLVGLNAKYMLDVLGFLDTDRVTIGVSGELDPVLVRPETSASAPDFVGVIMPMRV